MHFIKADLSNKCAVPQHIETVVGTEEFGFGKS